jgi:hypothetical protein
MQQSGGIAAEVNDVRKDVKDTLAPLAAIAIDEFTNPAAAGAADLEAATATTVAPRTVTTFLAGGVAKLAAFPRNVTFTTGGGTPADAPATALVTGTYRGKPQTETVTLAQTATIANGVKPFSTITSVAYAAADGTGATISIGVGLGLGTAQIPLSRAGLVAPVREIAAGAAVTNGVLTVEGLYTPNTAPNGTNDYAIFYEYNPTV